MNTRCDRLADAARWFTISVAGITVAITTAGFPLAGCAGSGPAATPPSASPAPSPIPMTPDAHPRLTLADLPAIHLIMHQAVPLPDTPRRLVATLLELMIGETDHGHLAIARVHLVAADGEAVDVTWTGGEERQALGSRLYLKVSREAFVYVLP
jgi:hypothetical protein